jgi:HD-GYP domain-containing protein (c-di-GMP phosphodiesterase class II)
MLVVPMKDHENVVVGVVQLINKKRHWQAVLKSTAVVDEEVIPFTPADEGLAGSLASQAAVAFENAKLLQDIRDLFDSFVHASVKAIEQRDPPTSGHSERVAILTVALAERVNSISLGRLAQVSLSTDQLRELEYAALLHDFGKVGVQEKYLRKKKKLFAGEMIKIRQRFAYILKSIETDYLRAQLDLFGSSRDSVEARAALDAEYQRRRADAERLLKAVIRANEPKVVADAFTVESVSAFLEGPGRLFMGNEEEDLFPVEDWAAPPFLSCAEVEALSIPRGSLTHREKEKINEHVSISYEFLTKIPWTGEFKDIPRIAYAHHEKLDGSGYPRRLTATEIPIQSRMMTISDIYDALVAQDRPYKKAEPPERALGILEDEQRRGQLDGDLLRVFIEAKIYDLQTFKDLIKRRT